MRNFILKRLIISVFILFCVSLVIYTLMRCLPTSFIEQMAREKSQQPNSKSYEEWLAQLLTIYGLDKSIFPGFLGWLKGVFFGDGFGDSWQFGMPVLQKFSQVIWYSFVLGAIALVFQVSLSIPLGVVAARKQYSATDYTVTVIALLGISLPGFFFATLLKLVLSVKLGWLDLYGMVGRYHLQMTPIQQYLDMAQHYIMPVLTLTWTGIGGLMRYTRTNMLEVLNSDYIRTARAKGLSENKVVYRHAFRNTLIPLVTIVGGTLPGLFSGALITETLFQIPGIGYTSYQCMTTGDIPFTMFFMMFQAVLTLAGTLLSDVLYAVVDPRVRVA